jgi:hypothetical protein
MFTPKLLRKYFTYFRVSAILLILVTQVLPVRSESSFSIDEMSSPAIGELIGNEFAFTGKFPVGATIHYELIDPTEQLVASGSVSVEDSHQLKFITEQDVCTVDGHYLFEFSIFQEAELRTHPGFAMVKRAQAKGKVSVGFDAQGCRRIFRSGTFPVMIDR